jgi:phosphoribosylanthranilate isomerase
VKVESKICGLSEPETLDVAVEAGARWLGFVFFPRSPRHVEPDRAAELIRRVPTGVRTVALLVDPDDAALERVLSTAPVDLIQLHGKETPERVAAIKARFAVPVMKAFRIGTKADLDAAMAFDGVADRLLFDAAPPQTPGALPGGNGVSFDWSLLAGRVWTRPWMLSGGLHPGNVAEAIRATGASAVDVSSGVEDRPGHKDPERIRAFLQAVAGAA